MKYYTEPLVNDLKKKKKISAFFLGDWRRTSYYEARHREKHLYLLWIEAGHFGKVICYPCVLEREDALLVFENSSLSISKDNNEQLVAEWNRVADSQRIREEFDVTELDAKKFNPLFSQYRKRHLEQAIAEAEAEAARQEENAALPEPQLTAVTPEIAPLSPDGGEQEQK